MTSNTVPIYRHGRKFYVSAEEYERIRSEERRYRRIATQKSQHSPLPKSHQTPQRSPSASYYNSIQRRTSTPHEFKYGVLKAPKLSAYSQVEANHQPTSNRLSRSTLRHPDADDDISSTASFTIKLAPSSATMRSNSLDKVLNLRRTPPPPLTDNEIQRSFSAEIAQPPSPPQRQRVQQSSQSPPRRPVPTTVADYGISPITTFSMTPDDQTYTKRNTSKLTNYFARMKQSTLNPRSKPPTSAASGTGSLMETSMQGSDQVYTVLGSSNRRMINGSSSLLSRPATDNSKNEYYHRDTSSGTFSDDISSPSASFIRRRDQGRNPSRQTEVDDDYGQHRDLWTRPTIRSQSSDGLLAEKKRVRFADMEGFTLATISNKNQLRSPINNQLLSRQQHEKVSSEARGQPRPFYNVLYQTTAKIGQSKLATDV